MANSNVPQDLPLDAFKQEMAACGFQWVKIVGHVQVHIFEHAVTGQVMPIVVQRGMVPAPYVAYARKICAELRGDAGPAV
jgi:hypothetical protein